MAKQRNIFLIGPMGAGKTSVGRHLAKQLQLDYYDSDQVIEERTGADLPWIFDLEGEEGFRLREMKVIDDLTNKQGIVLSTGGGSILRQENRKALGLRGIVIYLDVSIEEQVERTKRTATRPLLIGQADTRGFLVKLRQQREPLYLEIADLTYQTDSQSVQTIGEAIIRDIKSQYNWFC